MTESFSEPAGQSGGGMNERSDKEMFTLLGLHSSEACGGVARHTWLCLMQAKVIHRILRNQMSRVPQLIHGTWVFLILRLCSCMTSDELSSLLSSSDAGTNPWGLIYASA